MTLCTATRSPASWCSQDTSKSTGACVLRVMVNVVFMGGPFMKPVCVGAASVVIGLAHFVVRSLAAACASCGPLGIALGGLFFGGLGAVHACSMGARGHSVIYNGIGGL